MGTIVILAGLADASRIDEIHAFRIEAEKVGTKGWSGHFAADVSEPEFLYVGMTEKTNANTTETATEQVKGALGLKQGKNIIVNALRCAVTDQVPIIKHLSAWKRTQVLQVLFIELSLGILYRLIGKDVEALRCLRLEDGQIMVAEN